MQVTNKSAKKPELLAPCGSPEALDAAIEAGADAVYFGGTMFNARMNAKNFSREQIARAVSKCHEHGVKAYVTFNTLIYDREMKTALDYALFLYRCGVDALIVADIGLARQIKKYIPNMELHASTQMTAHNTEAVNRLQAMGFSRVVLARELSEENVKTVCGEVSAETELFVHGAICVSCSGQCLMSAMLGGRSGNRGECAQPCRLSYNGEYPISLRDMCLAQHIPSLISAGVSSLKIEGRMKSAGYVYGVTKIYRKLLDENRGATEREMSELARLFSRGGFTDGYYKGKIDGSMLGVRSERDIADSRESSSYKFTGNGGNSIPELKETDIEIPSKLEFPVRRQPRRPITTARFKSAKQIPDSHDFSHVYLPLTAYENTADGVMLPAVIFDSEREDVRRRLEAAVKRGARHVLIRNIGQCSLAKEFDLIPHGDFRLNTYNAFTSQYLAGNEFIPLESLILSLELTLPQIRDIYLEGDTLKGAVVYGRLPIMLYEKQVGKQALRDRRGVAFPIIREDNRDILLNSVPTYMADQKDRLDGAGIEERHMIFTVENRGEVMRTIYAYEHGVIPKDAIRRLK